MQILYIIISLFVAGNLATDFYTQGHLKGFKSHIVFGLFILAFLVFMIVWPILVLRGLWNALTTTN